MTEILSIVLGGGKGTRLFPLTKERSKPAVPFGGKYRIVDIPISNCINSGFKKIYILTQFNSASLHLHISRSYNFDHFSKGFVEILAAEQTPAHSGWYEGTADAVRKNLIHFRPHKPSHYLIVSGDQLYRMDLADMFRKHTESACRLTIAGTLVSREAASSLGIIKIRPDGCIDSFLEKPGPTKDIRDFAVPEELKPKDADPNKPYLASMGIYIFDAPLIEDALQMDANDFGKEIIPAIVAKEKVNTYVFGGYWEDIGTIRSFYEANIELTDINPQFNFYDEQMPIYTHARNLPASKLNYCTLNQALASDGCIITNASITRSIVGIRTVIESGASLDGVVCMGADYYETEAEKAENRRKHIPNIGIGGGSIIRHAIIDKNGRIGSNCRIGIDPLPREDGEYKTHYIVDGIIVIPKNQIIPDGTVI
ncbi:MAG: glucose-1-phosphate adenylyltransferase [Spirochaetia bacterium]|jgi:glucose-1-phosphate adenylyltransferase|uniref:Glucose-1-phosphate adenylyltransferase n=1 Tax=uncultured spirochete TaxID=156406 RepID=A0A3P3XF26_9SPIR|nr:glucose-1-phosphate adenylyltransferase [Rectinema subterraneum]MDQ7796202.1 glucose-1-phosphate adenylyltransferase [Spirochaetia bacterium]SLM09818.1 Glucose-1-phosphate adenylyltransferase [uncultured spirochete]HCX95783.1 glucose-1-phosphate adenylyltransferase [Spirochaetaceae bacterium]